MATTAPAAPKPLRTAWTAAWMRLFSFSFVRMLATWFLTVFSLRAKTTPISRLLSPVGRRRKISSSRLVRTVPIASASSGSCSREPFAAAAAGEALEQLGRDHRLARGAGANAGGDRFAP